MMPALIILLLATTIILIVPAWPAISEWRKGRDREPLDIHATYPEDRHVVAESFGREVSAQLEDAVQAYLASGGQPGSGLVRLRQHYDVIGPQSGKTPDFQHGDKPLVLVQPRNRKWPAGNHLSRQTFVAGVLETGRGSRLDRVFVDGDLRLGEECEVVEWAHAKRAVVVGAGSRLSGSVAANDLVHVWPGVYFERLRGREIRFGDDWHWPDRAIPSRHAVLDLPPLFRLNGRAERIGAVHRVDGDLSIPSGHVWEGDLVVRGKLRIGRNARIEGSVKAEGKVLLESGSSIDGQLFSDTEIEIRDAARVTGTAATEGDLRVRWGGEIGTPGGLSTATGRFVFMDQGARVHGLVVALEEGKVGLRTAGRLAEAA